MSGNLSIRVLDNCGISNPKTLALSLLNSYAVGNIAGPQIVCPYVNASLATYSVVAVTGASTYSWTAPNGATIVSGQGSNVVQVNYPLGFSSGTISVSVASYCGAGSTNKSLAVNVLPANPGAISGLNCITIGNSSAYSISSVTGASSYNWSVPSGATIISGQGTTNVNISFGSNYAGGNVTVSAINSCGSSSLNSQKFVGIGAQMPAQIYGPSVVCNLVGTQNTATYYVSPIAGATSYQWGVVSTAVIVSGQGTNTITVKFNSTFVSGNISCMSITGCGSSAMRYFSVSKSPTATNAITGLTNVTSIVGTGTSTTYSTAAISGVNSYTWTVSSGITILSGQGTNSTSLSYASGFTSGTITAKATTTCGNANPASIVVTATTAAIQLSSSGSLSSALRLTELKTKMASCYGYNDGSVTIEIDGGISPYTFEFNGKIIKNSKTISDLAAGDYTVNVIDFNGNSSKLDFTIEEPQKLETKSFIIASPSFQLLNDGHALIGAKGGTGMYSYSWSHSEKTQEVNNLSPGIYTATVTDENQCSSKVEVIMVSDENKTFIAKDSIELNIYPVPSINELNVEFKNAPDVNYLLKIISVDGKVFFSEILMPDFDTKTSLNTTVWPSGTYFVSLIDQNGSTVLVKKIVVQH